MWDSDDVKVAVLSPGALVVLDPCLICKVKVKQNAQNLIYLATARNSVRPSRYRLHGCMYYYQLLNSLLSKTFSGTASL